MIRKIILTIFWAIIFFSGSAFILRFCFGILLIVMANSGQDIINNVFITIIGTLVKLGPLVFGLVGIILGMRGKLPGMKLQPKSIETTEK